MKILPLVLAVILLACPANAQTLYSNSANGNVGIGTTSPVAGGGLTIAPSAVTTGSPSLLTITAPADTTLTASTEAPDVNFNLARTVQFATGAITNQRAMRIQAPTYSFVGASTITNAATVDISGPPVAGTNATITNNAALVVESGNVGIGTTSPGSLLTTSDSAAKTAAYTGVLHSVTDTSSTASINKIGMDIESTGTWNGTSAVNTGLVVNATGGTTNYAATFSGGNVGIGMTSPGSVLQVNGGEAIGYSTSTTAPTNGVAVKGAIGIGTTSPVAGGGLTIAPSAVTTGSPSLLTITAPADTTLTASTEAPDVNFNLARTVQFATGAITNQRAMRIQAPTYSFVGASTITNAATVDISGPPVAGTNATITNNAALVVESGNVGIGTATPSNPLTVNGIIQSSSGGFKFPDGTTQTTAATGSGIIDVQTFTSSGTWTKPGGGGSYARVHMECIGGGGGGSGGGSTNGGGGGGSYKDRWVALSSLGSTETVTVGTGGSGGANGANGGASSFGSWMTAYGGTGGGGSAGTGNGGAAGGVTATAAVGAYQNDMATGEGWGGHTGSGNGGYFLGGGGGAGSAANGGFSLYGGGGGGGASYTFGGGNGGVSQYGGNGGNYNNAGSAPGGGGGANSTGAGGANGAAGQCIATTFG